VKKPRKLEQKELKRVNINIDARTHDRFKAACAAEGKQMTKVLEEFIRAYVERHFPGQRQKKKR
jgi:molybdenum cofactor biosynthesis enzyme MoaA